MPFAVRLAMGEDVARVLEISNWAAINTPANFAIGPEPLEQWRSMWEQTHRMYPWLVATEGPEIIGFAKAGPHRGRCAYAWAAEMSVYIDPKHHGRRVGSTLYARLIPILRRQGYVTLVAGITTPNAASVRLHESFGFRGVGVFQRMGWKFGQWHNVGYWQCDLQDEGHVPGPILPVAEALAIESG